MKILYLCKASNIACNVMKIKLSIKVTKLLKTRMPWPIQCLSGRWDIQSHCWTQRWHNFPRRERDVHSHFDVCSFFILSHHTVVLCVCLSCWCWNVIFCLYLMVTLLPQTLIKLFVVCVMIGVRTFASFLTFYFLLFLCTLCTFSWS